MKDDSIFGKQPTFPGDNVHMKNSEIIELDKEEENS